MYSLQYIADNAVPWPNRPKSPNLNEVIGNFTLIGYAPNHKGNNTYFARCVCGKYVPVRINRISNGDKVSCGCIKTLSHGKTCFEKFLLLAEERNIHNYDISRITLSDYRLGDLPIVCEKHGLVTVRKIPFMRGHLCGLCGKELSANKRTKTTDGFILDAILVHGDKYNYKGTVYSGSQERLVVTCKRHGDFSPVATEHLMGRGCPTCNNSPFSRENPTWIYLSAWSSSLGEEFLKVGVTNGKPSSRLFQQQRKTEHSGEILCEKFFDTGELPLSLERYLKATYGGSYSDKQTFGDGYTETYAPTLKQTIAELISQLA